MLTDRKGWEFEREMAMGGVAFGLMLVLVTFSLGFASAGQEGLVIELESHTLSLGSATPKLEVAVKSPSGEAVPSATVSLISVHSVASGAPVSLSDNARFVALGDGRYELGVQSGELSVGKYKVRVDAASEGRKGFLASSVCASVKMEVSNTNVILLESDGAVADSHQEVKFGETVTVSATQAQKLKVEFQVKSPSGAPFKAQQVILKLRHVESGAEVPYLVSEGSHTLEFSKNRSGAYSVDLIVGDDAMENSFLWSMVSLDLEGSEESPVAPTVSKFAPRPEISHIFRQPEKRPPTYLSMAFLILTLLPLVGFLMGLQQLGVNLKNLPSGGLPLAASAGFHGGIAMILGLYFMFWVKLNLFTTLQTLGFLGLFTLVPGFHILSYLADHSAKVKSA